MTWRQAIEPLSGLPTAFEALAAHPIDDPFERGSPHRRLLMVGLYARARVTFKAARFRAPVKNPGLVQLRAAWGGALRAAFERAAQARGQLVPHEAAQGAWLQLHIERTSHEQDNDQPSEPQCLRRDQERQAELLAADRGRLAVNADPILTPNVSIAARQHFDFVAGGKQTPPLIGVGTPRRFTWNQYHAPGDPTRTHESRTGGWLGRRLAPL